MDSEAIYLPTIYYPITFEVPEICRIWACGTLEEYYSVPCPWLPPSWIRVPQGLIILFCKGKQVWGRAALRFQTRFLMCSSGAHCAQYSSVHGDPGDYPSRNERHDLGHRGKANTGRMLQLGSRESRARKAWGSHIATPPLTGYPAH